jgi:hypothetical protein
MGEIHQIEGARAMDSFQDWRKMMRLNLAPKPTKGIEEKLLKSWDQELGQKYSKITKMKNITAQHRR